MQTVEVARHVLKQERRRTRLAGIMALFQERGMNVGYRTSIPMRSFHALAMPARRG
jgi:hypothetical protein